MPKLLDVGYLKSRYKMHCFCCNKHINIGDEITKCVEDYGIELRYRVIKNENSFYKPCTGARWVHKECQQFDIWTSYSAIENAEILNKSNEYNEYDEYDEYDEYEYDEYDEYDEYEYDEYDSQDENLLYSYNHYNKKH